MELTLKLDKSIESKKLCSMLSAGGYSDDMTPFYTRNLVILDVKSHGPITKQNLVYAADSLIKHLPEPYTIFLKSDFKANTAASLQNFSKISSEEGTKQLYQMLSEGKCLAHSNYFSMIPQNLEIFWERFFAYFGKKYLVLVVFSIFDIAYGDISFLLINQQKAAFFTFFTTD